MPAGAATRQIATIVVSSLLAAYGLSALIWLTFDMRPGPPPEFLGPASQIGLVLRLLDTIPPTDRSHVLTAFASARMSVREGKDAPPVLDAPDAPPVRGLRHALNMEPGLAGRTLSVGFAAAAEGQPRSLGVVVAAGGGWLLFALAPDRHRHRFPLQWISWSGVSSFVAIPLLVGFISLWATRRVISPLERLVTATDGLGLLPDPVPVAEEGAPAVRQVARAFNSVSARLRRFVSDRTRMLASVSHDLRTPLTRLRLRTETIDDAATRQKMLNDIRTMESMITSTLAFIRGEAALEPIERVDIAVLLQTICYECDDAGNLVQYQGPPHSAASCRPQAFQRALVNLIDNALKFDASVVVRLQARAEDLIVTVEDDGPGIPDAQKGSVFQPFFRGASPPDSPDGVGLGLSIVKAIVESHQGRIELLDRVPHGLCVRLYIPQRPGGSNDT
jgi:signal transduction histidine kinase